ncbi:ATP-binding cassette domain-containing protein [Trueperella pyogenes]|uniref:ATP-binding cassette domain-containing protein n=1 Tax=Trueperella pyogenes TaxID=1661 RepID=UPI0023DDA34D|nr:ATP-binding cassette domain-containing protein [Trueperella pyogenes]
MAEEIGAGIVIRSVDFSYRRKDKPIFSRLDVTIYPGRTMLIGPNGVGKTTLMGLLARSLRPSEGEILYPGSSSSNFAVSWMPQHIKAIRSFTVAEQVSYIAWLQGCRKSEISENIGRVLEWVNLVNVTDAQTSTLSGGQLRRLGLAQALVTKPDLLILDEPTAGLDVTEHERLKKLLFGEKPLAQYLLVSTHDVRDLTESFDHVILLKQGRVAFSGSTLDFISNAPNRDPVGAYQYIMGN